MADVSHNGAIYTISASKTFAGVPIPISAFPKDTDPFDVPNTDIADMEIGTNGDAVTWDIQNPVESSLAIIPATNDHETLQSIYDANRAEKGKPSAKDLITLVRILPNGETTTLKGRITSGPATTSLASSGKIKTPVYSFKWYKVFRTSAIDIEQGF
ncbi:hypothetical protein MAELSTROM_37 [Pseudoalteromonas phage Maelstrom]|uniref:tail fiber protein n=1 Tax=Pseudoalteromonas phage Maelstrom TaxID=2065202 RepID=UPI000CA3825D|nr:tail fiber protein [Pseudoalteromonas phage Maelstrom]AUG84957.1 hypothetical protein MAELSTROM_37 [Pseudoalteromonas phage Maelstrom]